MSHTTFTVYHALCVPTGKGYVGVTSTSLPQRMSAHACKGAMHADLRTYGLGKFVVSVLHTCTTKEEALFLEDAAIKRLATVAPLGYNTDYRGRPARGGPAPGNKNSRRRPVMALYPDGTVAAEYDTVLDAAKALGIQRNTIHRAIIHPHYTAGWYHWRDAG